MHEGSPSQYLALLYQRADQDPTLQSVYTPNTPQWCRDMEYDFHVQDESMILTSVPAKHPAHSVYSTLHKRRSQTLDLPTASHSSHHDETRCQSSHQPSPTRLATPARSTDMNLPSKDCSHLQQHTWRESALRTVPNDVTQ